MRGIRSVRTVIHGRHSIDGAGVHLKRLFGFSDATTFDPFLLLDHFGSDNPDDYLAGFPWHPHRGIETITYMINGSVEHGDSLGNKGVISSGDLQWMTAGSGIIHQEMPLRTIGRMHGLQLWVNLPARTKMMDPRYRGIRADEIVSVNHGDAVIKVISGSVHGVTGPVSDLVVDVEYIDIALKPGGSYMHRVKNGFRAFAYLYEGSATFGPDRTMVTEGSGALFDDDGESVSITATDNPLRCILVSGMPIKEPINWCGPIVMNTKEECDIAFKEYESGIFVKVRRVAGV